MIHTIRIATRGSALALAQARFIMAACQSAFPDQPFELKVIKTTGDQLQSAPPDQPQLGAGKGLFTKELEVALLSGEADLAVHSLKDLPTDLPEGLHLAAVSQRFDPRDVLVIRKPASSVIVQAGNGRDLLKTLPENATIATSSTRRQAQLRALRPGLNLIPIRGNVGTRLKKLGLERGIDGLVLAAAGLARLQYQIGPDGALSLGPESDEELPPDLRAAPFETSDLLPAVGQAALGIEIRDGASEAIRICERLDHSESHQCALAERAFLRGMGGGCLSPIAAHAVCRDGQLFLRGVSFQNGETRSGQLSGPASQAEELGQILAVQLR